MVTKKDIEDFLISEFSSEGIFLVDVLVKPGNIIKVFVDRPEGISVKECSDISRLITGKFDRETEDYSLDVSSPGLDMPLVVKEQYEKNMDRGVQVQMKAGRKHTGELKAYNENGIEIEETKKIAVEGKKNKQKVSERITLKFDDIKAVKVLISFK